jgi:hypothetical protein
MMGDILSAQFLQNTQVIDSKGADLRCHYADPQYLTSITKSVVDGTKEPRVMLRSVYTISLRGCRVGEALYMRRRTAAAVPLPTGVASSEAARLMRWYARLPPAHRRLLCQILRRWQGVATPRKTAATAGRAR